VGRHPTTNTSYLQDTTLVWDENNLTEVLRLGAEALNIDMSPTIQSSIVSDAYGNVGLVQRLAEQLCLRAGVLETLPHKRMLDDAGILETARESVSQRMKARYDAFADDFVRGMKRMTEGLEVYKHMLRAFTRSDNQELLNGIDSRELLKRIEAADANANIRQSDLTQALDRVDRLQVKIGVRPLVLTYNRDRRRLFLADRSFLFYRQYGHPKWPWEKDDSLDAALRAAPDGEQLVLDDFPLSNKGLEDLAAALEVEADPTPPT